MTKCHVNKDCIGSFTRSGNNYRNWFNTASRLLADSATLRRKTRRIRNSLRHGAKPPPEMLTVWTEVMLAGFAVECLIKAVWLKTGNELVRDGEYKGILRNERHQLVPLCDRVGIPLSSTERRSLHGLSRIMLSVGRYPIPRKPSEVTISWESKDDGVVSTFVQRLELMLRSHLAGRGRNW